MVGDFRKQVHRDGERIMGCYLYIECWLQDAVLSVCSLSKDALASTLCAVVWQLQLLWTGAYIVLPGLVNGFPFRVPWSARAVHMSCKWDSGLEHEVHLLTELIIPTSLSGVEPYLPCWQALCCLG